MKLLEIYTPPKTMSYFGFTLSQEEELEEDNAKIWHRVTLPNGKVETLDHSPYEYIDERTFKQYVSFFKDHKRFPTRADIKSIGPLDSQSIYKLTR